MKKAAGNPIAFMSYTRFDDKYLGEALTRFREELSDTIRFLNGREIEIFQDVEGIKLGQNIQQQITASLNETLLLIPILTPSYFNSPWCREELELFLNRERQLGRNDLIISIYYQEVRELSEAMKHPDVRGPINDSLIREIAPRLASDWRSLQKQDLKASAVQDELKLIAQRIIDVVQELQSQPTVQPSVSPAVSGTFNDDQPAPGKNVDVDQRQLRDVMVKHFGQEELALLCHDIELELEKAGIEQQVNLEIVGGSGKAMQILNLIQYLDRRGYLSYLVAAVQRARPGSI
jgi:hypothetical protein